ncbi:MAG: tetratricopeptide repeat protein [Planctomycetales bacterium]|nr:tetratricopeptide repeat protein [Planctomycetales bacterium]
MSNSPPAADRIFAEALLRAAGSERAAFLKEACGDHVQLQERVERLLRAHDDALSFLETPPAAIVREAIPTIDQAPLEKPGTQIGPYKLLQQIGEGGMGVVYMAEQLEPVKRRVALKIIKPGMDTRQVIARFEAERQALSLMDHPNIAKVLDAGTTGEPGSVSSGRPYFVMELVKGQPITQYCDEKHLTPRQRLELLLPVCQAIQHAHQKGIIHRDIKPTNILVAEYDQQPVPKVIDFGVAKATSQTLTEKTMFTGLGQIVGTLEYMSPEQAKVNQLDIDTRSDIYSLGVLLYELLTGSTPFDRQRLRSAAFDEMLRIIREEEPPKPSTRLSESTDSLPSISAQRHIEPAKLTKLVRGELDWIVMKALEKDRNRRYETASAFSADLQHYLSDEPVVACPPSATYRLRKFVRRNKGRLSAASVLAVALLVAVSGVGWAVRDRAAREAEIAQERAQREAELGRERNNRWAKVAGQVESIFGEVVRLEKEQKWPEALAAARRAEAAVAGGEAEPVTAERVRERLRDLEFIDRLEQIRMQRATIVDQGRFDNAGAVLKYSGAFRAYGVDVEELAVETSVDRFRANPALAISLAAALDDWVDALRAVSPMDVVGWKRLVAVARGIDPEPLRDRVRASWGQPVTPQVQDELRQLAESINIRAHRPATLLILALTLRGAKQSDSALRLLRSAQYVYPGDYWLNLELGNALFDNQDGEGAIRFYTAAISIHPSSASVHHNLGLMLSKAGRKEEAITEYQEAIRLQPDRYQTQFNLGCTLIELGRKDEGFACLTKAIDLRPNHAGAWNTRATNHLHLGQFERAIADYTEAIRLAPGSGYALSAFYWRVKAYEGLKQWDKAIADYQTLDQRPDFGMIKNDLAWLLATCPDPKFRDPARAVELGKKAVDLEPSNGPYWQTLAWAEYRAGDWKAAVAAMEKVKEHGGVGDSFELFVLAMAHWQLGNKVEARKWYDDAVKWMDKYLPKNEELQRFRAEAEELMGVAGVVEVAPPPREKK